jgi:magnesium-transporting ATPase (P-type)
MNAPPRRRDQRLLGGALLARAYLFLGLMQAAAAMAAFYFVLHAGGWHSGQSLATNDPLYLKSTTACLSAIVVMQVANVFLCRSERRSLFFRGMLSNKLILAGVAMEIILILLIAYTPWGNALFGTAPIPPSVWLFILPFAAGMIALEELRKWILRKCEASSD